MSDTDYAVMQNIWKKLFYIKKSTSVRYVFTWNLGHVLDYLGSLNPLENLSLKLLTLKYVALVVPASAQWSQTLAHLDLNFGNIFVIYG